MIAGRFWLKSSDKDAEGDLLDFLPPNSEQRKVAIGEITRFNETLQRAFDPADEFAPMNKPGPRDWLANYLEGGQTFDTFQREEMNKPNRERPVIYLQPLGSFASDHAPQLEHLREFTESYFTLETRLLPALQLDGLSVATRVNSYTEKEQCSASDLMKLLEPSLPGDAYCLLGITLTDLFGGTTNFVFGQASLRGRVGVFSFARFDPEFFDEARPADVESLIPRRSCRALAHEIGHMFGLAHCIYFSCVMNGSNHLAESDSRPLRACPVCLRKLHASAGFDPIERDQRLLDFYRRTDFSAEAEWSQRRLARITTLKP